MITDVEVENYQSIQKASIKLGHFTAITGPTGSGKSALIRAIELVVSNARGTSYIRHGAKKCNVALGFRNEGIVVGIERGGRGADKYLVARMADVLDPDLETYTKLGGQVPPEVSRVLRLGDINFARQFDSPYLLSATGGQVARTLGELTNITLLFDAAREASRRKQETSRQLKAAEEELASLVSQAASFKTLARRREAAAEARERLISIDLIKEQLARLRQLQGVSQRYEKLAAECQARVRDVPSTEHLEKLRGCLSLLRALASRIAAAQAEARRETSNFHSAEIVKTELHEMLHELLVSSGVCPTCGQEVGESPPQVSGLWHDYQASGTSSRRSSATWSSSRSTRSARSSVTRSATGTRRQRPRRSSSTAT